MTEEASSEHLHRQARRGWLWGAVEQFAQRGLAMLVSLVLARMLAPASVSVFLTTAAQLIDGGIGSRIVQKKEILEEDYIAFFWCNAAVSLLTCGPLVIFAGVIARFYGNPQLRSVVMVLAAVVFLMNAGRIQELQLVRGLRFKIISLVTIGSVIAGSIAGLILAFAGCGVWAILGQQLVMSAVRAAAFWRLVPWRPAGLPSWAAVKDLYAFGMPIVISQTIRGFSEQLINMLAARYVGIAPLGYYDRGRFIPGNAASFVQSIFFRTNLTMLSKFQHDEKEFREAYLKLIGTIASVCMLMMTGMAVCAPEIIEIILGAKWLPSVWFFRAGCIMSSIYLLFLINLDILKAKGNVSALFRQNLIFAGLQAVGVGGGLFWGLRGMMAGSIAACLVSCLALILEVGGRSHISLKDQLRVFISPVIWSLPATVVLWGMKFLGMSLWVHFLLCGIVGACILMIFWYFSVNKRWSGNNKT
jgi:O-antigen/teichoic acid export membrane protein